MYYTPAKKELQEGLRTFLHKSTKAAEILLRHPGTHTGMLEFPCIFKGQINVSAVFLPPLKFNISISAQCYKIRPLVWLL